MDDILEQVGEYEAELSQFVADNELPKEWFGIADHIAVKGADGADFERLVEVFKPQSDQISCIDMDGRRLATAQLTGNISVGKFGNVSWVEIMEPRPEKVGKDVVGMEHMEFYFPDFTKVSRVLDDRKVQYEMQDNPGHHWVNIVINPKGQELKLNNKVLADVVGQEIKTGESYLLFNGSANRVNGNIKE